MCLCMREPDPGVCTCAQYGGASHCACAPHAKHRADVPVDSCRYGEREGIAPCETCAEVDQLVARIHRADLPETEETP